MTHMLHKKVARNVSHQIFDFAKTLVKPSFESCPLFFDGVLGFFTVFSRTFHAIFTHFSHFKMDQTNQNNGLDKRMLQILAFATGSDLLADSRFSSYTCFPPTLHSNTSAWTEPTRLVHVSPLSGCETVCG